MRRIVLFLTVLALAASLTIPETQAASFSDELQAFRARNAESARVVQLLATGLRVEQQMARSRPRLRSAPPLLYKEYQRSLWDLSGLVRRIVRDQRTADRLLGDILVLQRQRHEDAAVLLLRRSTAGQMRFMQTLARARTLLQRCTDLRQKVLAVPLRP